MWFRLCKLITYQLVKLLTSFVPSQRGPTLDRCKMMASARMDVEADGIIRNLTCFSPILEEICDGEPSKAALLLRKPFSLAYSEKNVITSVSH